MDQSIRLMVMIGLPGSGKTTFACRLVADDRIVSTDAIRRELFGDDGIQGPWAAIESLVLERLTQIKLAPTDAQRNIASPQYAVYDATNVVRRQRCRFLRQAQGLGFAAIQGCWLDYPVALCLKRNRSRSRQVPDAVVARMHRSLVGAPPALPDGFTGLVRIRRPIL